MLVLLSLSGSGLLPRTPLRVGGGVRMNVVDRLPPDYDVTSNNFISVGSTYIVGDWAAAKPVISEFLDQTRTEKGAMYSGWTRCGDKLHCREAYPDADFLSAHVVNVQAIVDKLLAQGATLDEVQVHGPAAERSKCEAATPACAQYFQVESGFTSFVRPYAGMSKGQSFLSLQPSFSVTDWARATPLMERCVALAKAQKGCVFFGWTVSGDQLFCRLGLGLGLGLELELELEVGSEGCAYFG
jgi:hypothetical protein